MSALLGAFFAAGFYAAMHYLGWWGFGLEAVVIGGVVSLAKA